VAAVLAELGGRSYAPELAAWVHGTDELPLERLLTAHGVQVLQDPAPLAQALGLRVSEQAAGITVKVVLDGSPAAAAGLAAGDEWLGLEVPGPVPRSARPARKGQAAAAPAWRLRRLDDVPLFAGPQRQVTALVARGQRLLRLPLALPAPRPPGAWRRAPADSAAPSWPGA
jgi:predicted metalloprotease with PDZ domain